MIAIAEHRIANVYMRPVLKVEMIIVGYFSDGPAVEQFIHHQKSHAIAQIEELRRRRIVRRANGIHSEHAQLLQAPLPDAQRDGGAEAGLIGPVTVVSIEAFH